MARIISGFRGRFTALTDERKVEVVGAVTGAVFAPAYTILKQDSTKERDAVKLGATSVIGGLLGAFFGTLTPPLIVFVVMTDHWQY